jgi:5'-nucleotidase
MTWLAGVAVAVAGAAAAGAAAGEHLAPEVRVIVREREDADPDGAHGLRGPATIASATWIAQSGARHSPVDVSGPSSIATAAPYASLERRIALTTIIPRNASRAVGSLGPAPATPASHVIAAGDTLWDLAKQFYGNGELWKKISEANGSPNPRRLVVGEELKLPAK